MGDRVVVNDNYGDEEFVGWAGEIAYYGNGVYSVTLDDNSPAAGLCGGPGFVFQKNELTRINVRQGILSEVEALMDEYDTVVHDSVPTQEAIEILHGMLDLIAAVPWEPSVLREAFMRLAVGALAIAQNVDSEAVEAAEEADVAF